MKSLIIFLVLSVVSISSNLAFASSQCSLSSIENPSYNTSINPRYNTSINPSYNTSINPSYNTSINPRYTSTVTYFLCNQRQNLVGSAIYASGSTVVLFQDKDWIGYTSSNGSGGFNFFDLDGEWKGYFVRTETGKYIGFDVDGEWVFTLTR